MGYINEPEGIDFYLDSKPLTEEDRNEISEIIACYKLTGRKRKVTSKIVQKAASVKSKKTANLADK